MKIGILGGTFDPPHLGHLSIARAALEHLELDEVILIPAHKNPLKRDKPTPAKLRLSMAEMLVSEEAKLSVSDIETTRGGPSYAIDTLHELSSIYQGDFWLLLGTDALKDFELWKRPDRVVRLCRLGVFQRPGQDANLILATLPRYVRDAVDLIPMAPLEVSSTEVRERIRTHRPTDRMIPASIRQFIEQNALYRN